MARKAKEAATKPDDKKPVEPVKQAEKPAEKGASENFDQYRAKH